MLLVGAIAAIATALAAWSKPFMIIVAALSGRKIEIGPDKITLWPK